jgi:hypothetical protein
MYSSTTNSAGNIALNHHHQYHQPIKSIINNSISANATQIVSNNTKDLDASFNKINLSNSSSSSTGSSSSSSVGDHHHPHHHNNGVKFIGFFENKIDEREKYLTAKYPNHQMALIKKRLKVEFWIDEQLKNLFSSKVSFFTFKL